MLISVNMSIYVLNFVEHELYIKNKKIKVTINEMKYLSKHPWQFSFINFIIKVAQILKKQYLKKFTTSIRIVSYTVGVGVYRIQIVKDRFV